MKSDGNGDRVTATPSADFTIPGQSKTIEFFVRSNGAWGAQEGFAWYGGTTLGWSSNTGNEWVFFEASSKATFQYQIGGNTFRTLADTTNLPTDTWVHIAVTWDQTTMTLWVAGTSVANSTTTPVAITTPNLLATTSDRPGTTTSALDGWFSNFRITNAARYSANFTPPTVPFSNTAATPPVAAFSGTPLSGNKPLLVRFTDQSTNTPTSWAWTFGDGATSTEQNPTHTYTVAGVYTVTLTATNAGGSDAETKTDYVTAQFDTHDGYLRIEDIEGFEAVNRRLEAARGIGFAPLTEESSDEEVAVVAQTLAESEQLGERIEIDWEGLRSDVLSKLRPMIAARKKELEAQDDEEATFLL